MRLAEQWIAGRLALVRALARFPAAVFPIVVAGTHGASSATDIFFLVYAGVLFAANTFALVETAVVPFVPGARRRHEGDRFVAAVFSRVALLLTPVAVCLAGGALFWRYALKPPPAGWEDGWLHLLILSALPAINAPAAVLSGYLNATERFLVPALAMGLRGVTALAIGFWMSPALGLPAYSGGILCGEVIALGWLLGASRIRLDRLSHAEMSTSIQPFWTLFLSLIAGGVANSSKGFVDRFVASMLGPGAVSLLEYAERLFLMTVSFLGAPLATVLLSRWAATFDGFTRLGDDLRQALRRAQRVAFALGLSILAVFLLITVSPGRQLLVGRFSPDEGRLVWLALGMYFLGALPYLLGLVATQAILVLRDSRFVTTVAVVAALANVPLDLLGMAAFGLPGIALGSAVLYSGHWIATELRIRSLTSRSLPVARRNTP
ncbi:hypothetical protein BH24ACI4_BH24ACI4_26430 [soil metagenome]